MSMKLPAAIQPWHLAVAGIALVIIYSNRTQSGNSTGLLGDMAGAITTAISNATADVTAGVLDGTSKGIGTVAGTIVSRVNPFDSRNLANQAVLGAGQAISGDPNWSLGSWIWDKTHPGFDGQTKLCTNFMGFGCG